jgi:hypothetical protein
MDKTNMKPAKAQSVRVYLSKNIELLEWEIIRYDLFQGVHNDHLCHRTSTQTCWGFYMLEQARVQAEYDLEWTVLRAFTEHDPEFC